MDLVNYRIIQDNPMILPWLFEVSSFALRCNMQ